MTWNKWNVDLDVELAAEDISPETLRRVAAKQLEIWQERSDKICDLYNKSYDQYNEIGRLRNSIVRQLTGAQVYLEMLEELTRVED